MEKNIRLTSKLFFKTGTTVFACAALLLFTACESGLPPNTVYSPEDLQDALIGALSGSPSVRLASEHGTALAASTDEDLMRNLRAGSVDAVLMESNTAAHVVSSESGVRILSESLLEYELSFAVPRENPQLLAVINSTLDALESNGTLPGLRDRFFAGRNFVYRPPEDVPPRPGYLILAVPPNAFPFSYIDNEGNFSGLNVYVARAICDFLGIELRIIEVDAADLVTAVWHGIADFSAGWLPDDIGDFVTVSNPFAEISHSIIVRR